MLSLLFHGITFGQTETNWEQIASPDATKPHSSLIAPPTESELRARNQQSDMVNDLEKMRQIHALERRLFL